MRWYPALAQFPMEKRRRLRAVENRMEDGSSLRLADPGAGTTRWRLEYRGLSESEAAMLETFFAEGSGAAETFTFLDPTVNLLSQSEDLEDEVWARDPLLGVSGGVADPMGGTRAWRLENTGAAAQAVRQVLEAPGWYPYCLSLWARSTAAAQVTLLRGGARDARALSAAWRRLASAGQEQTASETIGFGIELPPAAVVEVFGFQAEAQRAPSGYRPGSAGGVYTGCRFGGDILTVTCDAPGHYSCAVEIFHADHL